MMARMTKAQIRALQAVEAGTVKRVYRATGNVLIGPTGVSSRTLWSLAGLIRDGSIERGGLIPVYIQELTPLGRATLKEQT